MKQFFKTPRAILSEIERMERAEKYRRSDRATVSEFFNGKPPLTQAEAEAMGFTVNVNHLFGFTELTDARDQIFARYSKPEHLFQVQIDACRPGLRTSWQLKATEHATRVLRKCDFFDAQYNGVAGDAAMHGEGVFYFGDPYFPLPRQVPLSRMLVPEDAPTDPNEMSHFAIGATMASRRLAHFWHYPGKRWKKEALGKVLARLDTSDVDRPLDTQNDEEMEYWRQQNGDTGTDRRLKGIDVYFFFQARHDKKGLPYDLTILYDPARNNIDKETKSGGEENLEATVLCKDECRFSNWKEFIHPSFMDCIVGGESKWHRVLGTGTLNYQLNHSIELMICRIQQGGLEGSMNLWKASNAATREAMEQVLLHHNAIIPEGIDLIPNRFEPNFAGLLDLVSMMRQQGSRNAQGGTLNQGNRGDILEVQEQFEQNRSAARRSNRASRWDRHSDLRDTEIFRRLTNPNVHPGCYGYSEIMDFQDAMEREGVPLWYLQPENVNIQSTRLVGDGVREKELSIVSYLTANRQQYAPEMQPRITQICTALATDDYKLARELAPVQEEPDYNQELRAKSENAIMLTQRQPEQPKADDIDDLHISLHFPALQQLIQDGLQFQQAAFTPQQDQAFMAIGTHIATHITRIEAKGIGSRNNEDRDRARQYMEQMNEYAQMGQKLRNNMQQQQEGQQQQPLTEAEKFDMQMKMQQLQLQTDKLMFSREKFERTQAHKEGNTAFQQVHMMEDARRQDRQFAHDAALRDVEVATKVAQTKQKAEQPASK